MALTKGQRAAGKPNWTRKDYQVMAETCADVLNFRRVQTKGDIINIFISHCQNSAALTPNGNKNFNEKMFRDEVTALLA